MAIIGVCGYRQVDLSAKILAVLVSLEFLIVLVLDVAILIKGGEGGGAPLTATPFTRRSFLSGSVAIALLFNFASFIGFEATTIYSEEAKDPKRTVPRATFLAVLTIGFFYTLTTWLMVEGQGAAGLQELHRRPDAGSDRVPVRTGATYIGGGADHRDVAAVHLQRVRRAAGLPQRGGPLPVRARPRGSGPGGPRADPPAAPQPARRFAQPDRRSR